MLSFISRWPSAPFRVGAIVLTLAAVTFGFARADAPPGTVVVARSAPVALLIWDASSTVGDLVVARRTGDDGMRALESDGVSLLAARAPQLRAAKNVELHIQYAATGVAGAAYQASTFANATQLIVLTAPRALIAARARMWQAAIAAHRAPDGLGVRVVGAFPQAQ